MERCRGSCELTGQFCKLHRKHMKHSSDPPAAVMKEAFFQICLRNLRQASLSPKHFPYPACVWTLILQGSFLFKCRGFLWDVCPVQWSFPFLLFYCFSLQAEKCNNASTGSCEADITSIHRKHRQEVCFQANRQNCPHLLTMSMTTGVKEDSAAIDAICLTQ